MSKTITDLRETLFATLQAVKDGTMNLDTARAINELGKTITDTAKVEVDFLRATDGLSSGFIEGGEAAAGEPLPNGIASITRHIAR